jgi:acyl-CoA thioesterase-1
MAFKLRASEILVMLALLALAPGLFPHAHAGERRSVVVLGDSLAAGFGLTDPADAFPAQLQRALDVAGVQAEIVNAGVSGDTTAGGLARLDWAVPEGTHAVIVELGGNDALRGIPPQASRENVEAIVRRLKERGIDVLLAGMLAPPNMGEDYGAAFNAIFPQIAQEQGVSLYPFFLDGVAADPALNQPDGIHPNARGVARIVENILPAVIELLRKDG